MQSGGRRGRTRKPCLAVTPDTSGTRAGQLLPGLAGIAHPSVEVPLLRARRIGRARWNPFGDPLNASRRKPGSKPMTTQPRVSSLTLIPEPGSRTPPERENSASARAGQSISVLSRRPIVHCPQSMSACWRLPRALTGLHMQALGKPRRSPWSVPFTVGLVMLRWPCLTARRRAVI